MTGVMHVVSPSRAARLSVRQPPPAVRAPTSSHPTTFRAGLRCRDGQHRAEVDAIIAQPGAADVREHHRGAGAGRVSCSPGCRSSSSTSPATNSDAGLRAIEAEFAPQIDRALRRDPAGSAAVRPDRRGASRRRTSWSRRRGAEDAMLVRRYHLDFVLAGAGLDDDGRARLAELNQRLSTLSTALPAEPAAGRPRTRCVVLDVGRRTGRAERRRDRRGRGRRGRPGACRASTRSPWSCRPGSRC